MPSLADALRNPIDLAPNRIPRFYRGGLMLDRFRGANAPADDDRPEDWVGSATRTWSPPGTPPTGLGLSRVTVGGRTTTLAELLAAAPEDVIGPAMLERAGPTLGLLVKLLDAGQRLPVHCHPSREAARRLLGSQFGKTEAWLILGTREIEPAPRVWAGWREPIAAQQLRAWIEAGSGDEMLGALVEHPVRAGDAILIPAGTPHAIGPGVFLLELQEPTDLSVVAETRGFPISDHDASLGLGWETAIGFFETAVANDLRQQPAAAVNGASRLFGASADPYFRALRLTVQGPRALPIEPGFAIGVVVAGSGTITGATSSLSLRAGTTFALPAAAVEVAHVESEAMELVLCLPPPVDLVPGR